MFGKTSWTERIKAQVEKLANERFAEYREELAEDISRGLARLARLWVLSLLGFFAFLFVALALAFLLAWLLQPYLAGAHYALGFGLVALAVLLLSYKLMRELSVRIEEPVYQKMAEALRAPKQEEPEDEQKKKPESKDLSRTEED